MNRRVSASSMRPGIACLTLLIGLTAAGNAAATDEPKKAHQPIELLPAAPIARPDAQTVLGRSEKVAVFDGKKSVEVVANLDTKEVHTTLYVADMKYFMRDSEQWVNFRVDNGHVMSNQHVDIERKVLRDEHVKERGGGVTHRPWVEVTLCIGKHSLPVQLALADRSAYTAQLKLGTEDIDKVGRVDTSLQFTAEPDCAPPGPPAAGSAPPPP